MTEFAQNIDKQLNRLGKEFQSVINKITAGISEGYSPSFYPASDVIEGEDELLLFIDLPGVRKEDIKLLFVEGELRVEGNRVAEQEDKIKLKQRERGHGDFSRTFILPTEVEEKNIKAKLTNGVLKISISKSGIKRSKTTISIE